MVQIPKSIPESLENILDFGVGIFNAFRDVELTPQSIATIYDLIKKDTFNLKQQLIRQYGEDSAVPGQPTEEGQVRLTYRILQRHGETLKALYGLVDKRKYKTNSTELPREAEDKLNNLMFFYYRNISFKDLSKSRKEATYQTSPQKHP